MITKTNRSGVTSGAETANPSGTPAFTPDLCVVPAA
jgi:hypothetical protein